MNTQIVYVLVSNEEDYYLENLLMSVYSLRLHNENAKITVVTDDATYKTLKGKRSSIKKQVDTIIHITPPSNYEKKQISRFLKVSLRDIIQGTYLFLDTDTIIIDDLSSIDNCESDIAMVLNANSPLPVVSFASKGNRWLNSAVAQMGWDELEGAYHFNSGVIYAKDSQKTHLLYELWKELWTSCTKKNIVIDQPALCKANKELGGIIELLENTYNWQIQRHGSYIPVGTRIVHYFSNDVNHSLFILAKSEVMESIREHGSIPDDVISYIKNVFCAFPRPTYVIDEQDYQYLQTIKSTPFWQFQKNYPFLLSLLNKFVTILRLLKKLFMGNM